MDLSRAFDTINQDLFIVKLHIFLFSKESLKLIKSYLTNRWQKTKLNTGFSKQTDILSRVLQEFVLGLVFFNSYIKGLFFLTENTNLYVLVMSRTRFFHLKTNVCNYADVRTFYVCDSDLYSLILRLEHDSVLAIEWFESN